MIRLLFQPAAEFDGAAHGRSVFLRGGKFPGERVHLLPEGVRGPQNGILQGAFLRDGVLFLPVGVGTEDHPHEIFYADLRHPGAGRGHLRWGHYDFTDLVPWEPEDYDIWNDRLVFPCNTDSAGVVYSLPYRKLVKAMVKE